MDFKDYYKIMGVAPEASAEEIKRAYRKLARKFHPDVSKEVDAEARFKEVGEAYEVLKDPGRREQYDQLRKGGFGGGAWRDGESFRPPPGWPPGDGSASWQFGDGGFRAEDAGGFSEFFESLFGGARRRRAHRGEDIRARVEIDLETAFAGGVRRIQLQRPERAADGSVQQRLRSLDVRIPAGMTEGRQIRLAGKGDPGPGNAPNGDLYLEIHITPHRLFELDGRDLHLTLPIAPWEAALGARIKVPTLAGPVELSVPAGATSGQRLRLKGRGLPGQPPGDQYAALKIVAPAANDEEQRRLYERLAEISRFNPRSELESVR